MENKLNNVTWDNSSIYRDFEDSQLNSDIEMIERVVPEIEKEASVFEVLIGDKERDLVPYLEKSQSLLRKKMDISTDLKTLSSFAYFQLSTQADHKGQKFHREFKN